ncbi:helix-turn-helix domain-containing protein [Anaerotruncus sp. X29]|uniref:helix-turn-helix domain-containing protein n=1 Tax=Anaerotruncus sp. G3(2012) TaxID=1235835 RepID=UPI00033D05F0|nr:helix-turn-helix domain-containing protein [Anaerotruncus sp. G3(2012)]EOS64023.1 hypothetical protein C814_00757 [Anaerotruncus sp. G3(2012)]NCE73824.1 helix-turn-helix domain-containing protein [Anaerotruncus sp. X29]
MQFSENLQLLRKKNNMTQEQLAEHLQVSRQAVSKWEAAQSYPEMENLLEICSLFSCDLDMLVRGDVEKDMVEDTAQYDRFYNQFSVATAGGVALIILGLAAFLWMEESSETLAYLCFLPCLTIGLFLFVLFGIRKEYFEKQHPQIVDFYTDAQRQQFGQWFAIAMASSVTLLILGVLLMQFLELQVSEDRASAGFMLLVAAASWIFIYFGLQKEKYNVEGYNRRHQPDVSNAAKKVETICGVILLAAAAVFLAIGILSDSWSPAWVVFPIGGIACGIVSIVLKGRQ